MAALIPDEKCFATVGNKNICLERITQQAIARNQWRHP